MSAAAAPALMPVASAQPLASAQPANARPPLRSGSGGSTALVAAAPPTAPPSPAALAARLARAQRRLLRRHIWQPPTHSICLRRCLYMAIRQAALDLGWSTVRDEKDATVQWIDRWESSELANLVAPRKVRGELLMRCCCCCCCTPCACTPTQPHTHSRTTPNAAARAD